MSLHFDDRTLELPLEELFTFFFGEQGSVELAAAFLKELIAWRDLLESRDDLARTFVFLQELTAGRVEAEHPQVARGRKGAYFFFFITEDDLHQSALYPSAGIAFGDRSTQEVLIVLIFLGVILQHLLDPFTDQEDLLKLLTVAHDEQPPQIGPEIGVADRGGDLHRGAVMIILSV